jgi:hypothetical protein
MAPNRDATFNLDVHTKRAFGGSVSARYLERGGFSGSQSFLYLRDWRDEQNYVEFEGEHDYRNPSGSGISAFLEIEAINHTDFYRLYNLRIEERASRFLESKGEASADVFEGGKAYLLARVFQDLRDGENNGAVIQHVPELGLFVRPREAGPLVFTLQADAANFFREDGQWGRRARLEPELSHAVGKGVTLFQSMALGARAYDLFEPDDRTERLSFGYEAALRTRLRKAYGRTTHYLEPTLSFIHRSLTGDSPDTLFDSVEAEKDASVLEASLMNRFKAAGVDDILLLKVTEQYDLESGRPFLPITFSISSARPFALRGSLSVDPYGFDIEAVDVEARVDIGKDALLLARERYSRPEDSFVHAASLSFKAARNVQVESGIWYDSETGGLRDFRASLNYISQCWSMKFTFSKKPDDVAFYVQFELLGLGNLGG